MRQHAFRDSQRVAAASATRIMLYLRISSSISTEKRQTPISMPSCYDSAKMMNYLENCGVFAISCLISRLNLGYSLKRPGEEFDLDIGKSYPTSYTT